METLDNLLCSAVDKSLPTTVDFLLKKGANPNVRIDDIESVLFMAVVSGYLEVVEVLLAHGANPNEGNGLEPRFALHEALRNRDIEVAKCLIKYGANPFLNEVYGDNEADAYYVANRRGIDLDQLCREV